MLHTFLSNINIPCTFYHGKLSGDVKTYNYNQWKEGVVLLMISTSAFGMGIDKGNVKYIIHTSIPFTMIDYIQQIGRCGRNGDDCTVIIFYHFLQLKKAFKILKTDNNVTNQEKINNLIHIISYCENLKMCRHKLLKHYLQPQYQNSPLNCNNRCDNCIRHFELYNFKDAVI